MKKKSLRLLVAIMATLMMTACGGEKGVEKKDVSTSVENTSSEKDEDTKSDDVKESTNNTEDKEEKSDNQQSIDIEDIDWSVEEAIIDGQKVISFGYTNNTDFTIVDVEMKFVQKTDVTKEQLAVFDNLKQDKNWSDEEIAGIYILGYNRKLADPGEKVGASLCTINGTYTLVENMEQYNLMQPDSVSIAFIGNDDKAYMTYYDFNTQKYGESTTEGKNIQEWSNSKISSLVPRPEFRVVVVGNDDDDDFSFTAYGVSRDDYNTYLETCKSAGFTDIQSEGDNDYRALNVDGFEINVAYDVIEESLYASIEKTSEESPNTEPSEQPSEDQSSAQADDGSIDPEFKDTLDSYEAFIDEYIAFLQKYQQNPNDVSLLTDYTDYMTKYTELTEKIENLDKDNLNEAEMQYYTEVITRVSQKLMEASAS